MTALRILMVAPQPFLRARGTPFSVYHRIRALLNLGHTVELVTYPFGEDVEMKGLKIVRCPRPPGVRDVPIGPSIAKALTDIPLFQRAWRIASERRHDLLHTHEEAGSLGAVLRSRLGLPHLYDMHSSLPQQFQNFGRLDVRPVVSTFERLERHTLAHADGVIAICPALADRARAVGYEGPLEVIENVLDFEPAPTTPEELQRVRRALGVQDSPLVVYTGTLETYQGLDLLVASASILAKRRPEARVLVVGGTPEQSAALQAEGRAVGADPTLVCVPAVPPQEVALYHRLADVLVTTRARGTNTPLKIYQYLRSGKPIVATDIFSHTQVLDPTCAELVEPEPNAIAAGLEHVLDDADHRVALARQAERIATERYGAERYHRLLQDLLDAIRRGAARPSATVT